MSILRRRLRRAWRTAREWGAGARLMGQRADGHGRSLSIIGDSHAVLLVEGVMPSRRVVSVDPTTTLLYLGPRLMHSVGRDGFPSWVLCLVRRWRRSVFVRGRRTVALLLGEIDLRCHLAKPGRSDEEALNRLVESYLVQVRDLASRLGPEGQVVVCAPNPPSTTYESDEAFPVVGTADERADILDRLCRSLANGIQAANDKRVRFLDVRPLVAGPNGHLREEFTFDGCHLNAAGAALVRAKLAELTAA